MRGIYLAGLLVSLAGLAYADFRWRLALFLAPARAIVTLVISVSVFLAWDLLGVTAGVFFPGQETFSLGLQIYPGVQLEEPFFLILLCYCTLLAFEALSRKDKAGGR